MFLQHYGRNTWHVPRLLILWYYETVVFPFHNISEYSWRFLQIQFYCRQYWNQKNIYKLSFASDRLNLYSLLQLNSFGFKFCGGDRIVASVTSTKLQAHDKIYVLSFLIISYSYILTGLKAPKLGPKDPTQTEIMLAVAQKLKGCRTPEGYQNDRFTVTWIVRQKYWTLSIESFKNYAF